MRQKPVRLSYLKLIGQQVHGADNAVMEEDDLEDEDADNGEDVAAEDDKDVEIAAKDGDGAVLAGGVVSRLRRASRGECGSRRQRCMTQLARLLGFASMIVGRPNRVESEIFLV